MLENLIAEIREKTLEPALNWFLTTYFIVMWLASARFTLTNKQKLKKSQNQHFKISRALIGGNKGS